MHAGMEVGAVVEIDALLLVRADTATDARAMFDADPWMGSILQIAAIERWILWVGADRFYLGQTGLGVAKLLTCGGLGIWAIVDLVLIGMGKMRDIDGNSLKWDKQPA